MNELEDVYAIGAGPLPKKPTRLDYWRWNLAFHCKRLHVCILVRWYVGHWPMNDLSTAEWRFQLCGVTAYEAFIEGWCRAD